MVDVVNSSEIADMSKWDERDCELCRWITELDDDAVCDEILETIGRLLGEKYRLREMLEMIKDFPHEGMDSLSVIKIMGIIATKALEF